MLKLFYYPGACSLAPHIALEEAGATYETQLIDLHSGAQHAPDYLKVNPKGQVPALQTDRGVITENPVILTHIAQSYPDAKLADLQDRFALNTLHSFNIFLATNLHTAFGHAFVPARWVQGDEATASLKSKVGEIIDQGFALVDAQLSDGRPYVHGDRYTISDPYLLVFERWLGSGLAGHPERFRHVQAHRSRIEQRPAVQRVLKAEGLNKPS